MAFSFRLDMAHRPRPCYDGKDGAPAKASPTRIQSPPRLRAPRQCQRRQSMVCSSRSGFSHPNGHVALTKRFSSSDPLSGNIAYALSSLHHSIVSVPPSALTALSTFRKSCFFLRCASLLKYFPVPA